jgi:hypothetical protein
MAERGSPGFHLEAGQTLFESRFERAFDRDSATQVYVLRKQNLAHAAAPENLDDLVLADLAGRDILH